MPRKSNLQANIELKMRSLAEDRKRMIETRADWYAEADKLSESIKKIEGQLTVLAELLSDDPEIIKQEEKDDAIQE